MSRVFNHIKSLTKGKYNFQLYDTTVEGTTRYRLMKHDTIENRYDTFTSATKEEFEKTMEGEWVKWKDPHGHQVIKENENTGVTEVVYQRLPPHELTPKSPKGEVVKDSNKE